MAAKEASKACALGVLVKTFWALNSPVQRVELRIPIMSRYMNSCYFLHPERLPSFGTRQHQMSAFIGVRTHTRAANEVRLVLTSSHHRVHGA